VGDGPADPTGVVLDQSHRDDPDILTAVIDEVRTRKPHLASGRQTDEMGQCAAPPGITVDIAGQLPPTSAIAR
jgi:hypothetical protein